MFHPSSGHRTEEHHEAVLEKTLRKLEDKLEKKPSPPPPNEHLSAPMRVPHEAERDIPPTLCTSQSVRFHAPSSQVIVLGSMLSSPESASARSVRFVKDPVLPL